MRRLLLIAISTGLAMGCAAPGGSITPTASAQNVSVQLMDFKIEPSAMTVQPGTVVFAVRNSGPTPHNFTIRNANGESLAATAELKRQTAEEVSAELSPGEYTYFCALPGHESLGMHGTLVVQR